MVGSQDRTWGEGRRTDAERRVKETSNTAAWLNVALVTEAGSRGARRAFIRYDDLLADWRTALAGSPTSSTWACRSTRTAGSTPSSTPACAAPS